MTPFDVVCISALLFSLALNGILGAAAISVGRDLEHALDKLWQMHLEKNPTVSLFKSGEVVKQPCTGTRMSGFRAEGNVVFLNNAEQSVD
jgi:hypothetical protein